MLNMSLAFKLSLDEIDTITMFGALQLLCPKSSVGDSRVMNPGQPAIRGPRGGEATGNRFEVFNTQRGDNLTYVVPVLGGAHSRNYVVLSSRYFRQPGYAARPRTYGVPSRSILLVRSNVIRAIAMIARFDPDRTLIRSYFLRIARSFPIKRHATSTNVPRNWFFPMAVMRPIRTLSALEYCDGVNPTYAAN